MTQAGLVNRILKPYRNRRPSGHEDARLSRVSLTTTNMSGDEGGSTKKSGYRLEYASSARAKCKGTHSSITTTNLNLNFTPFIGPKPCAGTPITKGELRIGSIVDFKGNTSLYVQPLLNPTQLKPHIYAVHGGTGAVPRKLSSPT